MELPVRRCMKAVREALTKQRQLTVVYLPGDGDPMMQSHLMEISMEPQRSLMTEFL